MPSMRIHFTEADLARTRLSRTVDPMWEIVNSVQALQHRHGALYLDNWRGSVRALARRNRRLGDAIPALMEVAPESDYFPDFLTPVEDLGDDVEHGIGAVRSTARRRLRDEIGRLDNPTPRLDDLAAGRPEALRDLGTALRTYYLEAVHPHLPRIKAALRVDRVVRGREGIEAMLSSFSPMATWSRPVLSFEYPYDRDLYLKGRGLRLVPSYFCVRHPVSLADPDLPPVLTYPIAPASRLLAAPRAPGDRLRTLLGPTRATILCAVVETVTTNELARRMNISPATVSHHTTVLRSAGLITTDRHRTFAHHAITSLGLRLLAGS